MPDYCGSTRASPGRGRRTRRTRRLRRLEVLLPLCQLGDALLELLRASWPAPPRAPRRMLVELCSPLELGHVDDATLEGLPLVRGRFSALLDLGLAVVEARLLAPSGARRIAPRAPGPGCRARPRAPTTLRSRSESSRSAWRSSCSRTARISSVRLSSDSRASSSLRKVCSRSATRMRSTSSCSANALLAVAGVGFGLDELLLRAPRFARRDFAITTLRCSSFSTSSSVRLLGFLGARARPSISCRTSASSSRRSSERSSTTSPVGGRRRTRGGCGSFGDRQVAQKSAAQGGGFSGGRD